MFDAALAQLPERLREPDEHRRRAMLVHTVAAGATHESTTHPHEAGVAFPVGAYLHHFDIHTVLAELAPAQLPAGTQVIEPRDGACVAETTGLVNLGAWLVPSAGLLPAAALTQNVGLGELVEQRVRPGLGAAVRAVTLLNRPGWWRGS